MIQSVSRILLRSTATNTCLRQISQTAPCQVRNGKQPSQMSQKISPNVQEILTDTSSFELAQSKGIETLTDRNGKNVSEGFFALQRFGLKSMNKSQISPMEDYLQSLLSTFTSTN